MFASDYPHRHGAEELAALPAGLPAQLTRRLLADNAREHYRL
jgi:predicted TIM-barrel fold metal-dependent hydrolase